MMHKTQNALVLAHLESGKTISQMEAIWLYRCGRLAARVEELRKRGHLIKTEIPQGQRYGVYSLIKSAQ